MKVIGTLFILIVTTLGSNAAGFVTFANSASTLIRVDGAPMPPRSVQEFVFAVFLAPPSTVASGGQFALFTDPAFQLVGGYNTNHPSAPGRLTLQPSVDVGSAGGYNAGEFVDFVVRGWSANMGYTWTEALASWNHGSPLVPDWAIGSSTVGNDLLLGGGVFPNTPLFGIGPSQVGGFELIPEPSSLLLAVLGAGMLVSRRATRGR